jgi:hypothetical protein
MALADVRFGAHSGLKSDIAQSPKSANGDRQQKKLDLDFQAQKERPPRGGSSKSGYGGIVTHH